MCAEFHDASAPTVLCPGPIPSECPTCAVSVVDADVQSEHVCPVIRVPSAFDPVSASCSTGDGDPVHCPLIRWPRSSMKIAASPVRAWSSVRLFATTTLFAFLHGCLLYTSP